jgi:hypothetical protein
VIGEARRGGSEGTPCSREWSLRPRARLGPPPLSGVPQDPPRCPQIRPMLGGFEVVTMPVLLIRPMASMPRLLVKHTAVRPHRDPNVRSDARVAVVGDAWTPVPDRWSGWRADTWPPSAQTSPPPMTRATNRERNSSKAQASELIHHNFVARPVAGGSGRGPRCSRSACHGPARGAWERFSSRRLCATSGRPTSRAGLGCRVPGGCSRQSRWCCLSVGRK